MKKTIVILSILLLALTGTLGAQAMDFTKLLAEIDERTDFGKSDVSLVGQMKIKDPENGDSEQTMAMFRRDAKDSFVALILAPDSKKGTGYLLNGDNFWTYDPVSRKFSYTSFKDNFQGSDAKNSDFLKTNRSTDYSVTGSSEGKLGKFDTWILDLTAKNTGVTYPKQKLWIDQVSKNVLKSEDYSLSGRLLRTSLYPTWVNVGKKVFATRQIFNDALVAGKRTELLFTEVSDKPLTDEIFTKAFLEKATK